MKMLPVRRLFCFYRGIEDDLRSQLERRIHNE
ncbi:hypothetical protein BAPNAU_2400 [Bacillus velezensis NAU-B3]|nr:hypothetical protein BAPNAU_2400 [Bacillus velezensis NAU-B3]